MHVRTREVKVWPSGGGQGRAERERDEDSI